MGWTTSDTTRCWHQVWRMGTMDFYTCTTIICSYFFGYSLVERKIQIQGKFWKINAIALSQKCRCFEWLLRSCRSSTPHREQQKSQAGGDGEQRLPVEGNRGSPEELYGCVKVPSKDSPWSPPSRTLHTPALTEVKARPWRGFSYTAHGMEHRNLSQERTKLVGLIHLKNWLVYSDFYDQIQGSHVLSNI